MKVNDSNNASIAGAAASTAVQPPASVPKSGAAPSPSTDQVQLSSLGSSLGALQTDSAQRDAKLSQLAAMVSNGSYSVDSKAVSAAMVAHAGG